jgi:ABC-type Fe3+ transport system substrate-binding protein
MRRYLLIAMFVIVLTTPMLLRKILGMGVAPHTAGEENTLVIITAHNEGIRREFAEAFSAWRQQKYGKPAGIDYRFLGGSDIVKYFDDATKANTPFNIDLAWGGGDYLFDKQLKGVLTSGEHDYLQPMQLPPSVMNYAFPKPELGGVPLYDTGKPPQWFGAALSSFGILYNKDVLHYLNLPEPKTWSDLTDFRFSNWIIAADPTRSASAKTAFMIIFERAMADANQAGLSEDAGWANGMGTIRLICSNARLFASGAEAVPGIVASGDGAAAMCIDFYARSQVDAIGEERLGYVEPIGATAVNPDPIALVKGAPHPELAEQFVEFVLSPEGQHLWNARPGSPGGPKETALRRLPIAPSAYNDSADFVDKVNPYRSAGTFNKSTKREGTFPIVGELIEFSCMDLLDELRATRIAIEHSPHATELRAKLGHFPFDQKEALRRARAWNDASPAERLRLQRQWTDDFREEYCQLRQQAGE